MRFNKAFLLYLKICPVLEKYNNITHSQLPTHKYIYGSFHLRIMSLFSCQPMRIKKPYSSPPTRNTCCCDLPTHLWFYGNFHLRNTSLQVVNQ